MNKEALIATIITGAGTMDLIMSKTFDWVFVVFAILFIASVIWLYKTK